MAQLIVVYWRDIPAQVIVKAGRTTAKRQLTERFEKAMTDAGKAELLTLYWYEADHAFANPTGGRFDADDARLAWDRTVEFLRAGLA